MASGRCELPQRHRRVSGFTLLELLITLVVLAIVVALAAPSFVDVLDRRRIVDATETMMKQVQQGRAVAIQTNRRIGMVFTVAAGGDQWCFGLTDNEPGPSNPAAPLCDCTVAAIGSGACTIPLASAESSLDAAEPVLVRASHDQFRGVRLSNGPANLQFEPLRGLLIFGMGIPVEFESARGREAHVVVNLLGRAVACSPDRSVETMRACVE
jgi:type IV fimbrial biogenesis protein FimT